jgi:hypothetical protein
MYEMGGECGTYGGEKRIQNFGGETERKRPPVMPGRRWQVIAGSQTDNI